ncbi:MAG: methyltransferase domain-containing protein [Desulfocurvibacter africanus]
MSEIDLEPAALLREFGGLFSSLNGPVLDMACGSGRNGLYLASLGAQVLLCDRDAHALERAQRQARDLGLHITTWQIDLEAVDNPLPAETYGGIIVFRYLHRPLFPSIRRALKPGGLLAYETYSLDQPRFGKPTNPDFLLRPGELREAFSGFEIIHAFEGILENPTRAMAQIICRKPLTEAS